MKYTNVLSKFGWAIGFAVVSFSVNGHNKVVVVPLGADESSSKKIFMTKADYTGDLGGPVGADLKCQNEANTLRGSKVRGIAFKALISGELADNTTSRRVINRYDMPYTDVNGASYGDNFNEMYKRLVTIEGDFFFAVPANAAGDRGFRGLIKETNYTFCLDPNNEFTCEDIRAIGNWSGFLRSGTESADNCNNWTYGGDGLGVYGATNCVESHSDELGDVYYDQLCSESVAAAQCSNELPLVCVEQ